MKKGQLTIEYLLILVILIMVFTGVSTELMDFATTNTLKIQTKELQEIHNNTLHSTVSTIGLQAQGAKQTLTITAPPDCNYTVSTDKVTLNCIKNTPSENYTGTVIGEIPSAVDVDYTEGEVVAGETGKLEIIKTS